VADETLFGRNDFIFLHSGEIMRTHPESACESNRYCCIHKPSSHPLNNQPLMWRSDRRLMERLCTHGVGHPDPDDLRFKSEMMPVDIVEAIGIHGCDGCCQTTDDVDGTREKLT
jgi:hypothetical protein